MNAKQSASVALIFIMQMVAPAEAAAGKQSAEDAVRAVENEWSKAFITGDTKTLDELLLPGYVSVNQKGRARAKKEILDLSSSIAAQPNRPTPTPSKAVITVNGNAAIATYSGGGDTSVDVFVLKDGHWRAWYSQHTGVAP
jgi:ketosteroid isomerase-like protein